MEETGFKCPKCGQTEEFDIHTVVLVGKTHITPGSWNYFDYANDVGYEDDAWTTCCACGHEGHARAFADEQCRAWWPEKEEI